MTSLHFCSSPVVKSKLPGPRICGNTASVEEAGIWYCRRHSPGRAEWQREQSIFHKEIFEAYCAKADHRDAISDAKARIVELARELAKVPGAADTLSLAGTIGSIVLAVAELEQLERQS